MAVNLPAGIDPSLAQLYQQSGLQPADRGTGFADWQYWQDKMGSSGRDYIMNRLKGDLSGTGTDQPTGTPGSGVWDNSGGGAGQSQPGPSTDPAAANSTDGILSGTQNLINQYIQQLLGGQNLMQTQPIRGVGTPTSGPL